VADPEHTVVTFRNATFNTTEAKDYFVNPECYGDDLGRWFISELRARGVTTEDEPGPEDFGWYVNFELADGRYCLVITHSSDDNDNVEWLVAIERARGLWASILGGRRKGIGETATRLVHDILSASSDTHEIRWHRYSDFSRGRMGAGSPTP
jgi:hypothetical protein